MIWEDINRKKIGIKYELNDIRVANDDDVKRVKNLLGIT